MKYILKIQFFGGRGATYEEALAGNGNSGGQVSTIDDDLPARMNRLYNGKKMSFDNTLEVFRKEHATDVNQEHGLLMDENGFVSLYTHGSDTSVYLTRRQDKVTYGGKATNELLAKGKLAVHNHPNNSFYSKADLKNFAVSPVNGTIVVGKTQDYILKKTSNFNKKYNRSGKTTKANVSNNAKRFYNYVKNHSYSEIESFLESKDNQRKYGFTYEKRKR